MERKLMYVVSRFNTYNISEDYWEEYNKKSEAISTYNFLINQNVVGTTKIVKVYFNKKGCLVTKTIQEEKITLAKLVNNQNKMIFSDIMRLYLMIFERETYRSGLYVIHNEGIELTKQHKQVFYKNAFSKVRELQLEMN